MMASRVLFPFLMVLIFKNPWALANSEVDSSIPFHLRAKSAEIVDYLLQRQLRTVGVLKFRVQKPGEGISDHVGPLNSLLSDRLEMAIILANPFEPNRELKIIKNASSQVRVGSTHLTKEGRAQFFAQEFELAWGNQKAKADAFLTGIVQVQEDGRTAKVAILCFDHLGSQLERIGETLDVSLDPSAATEMGESYLLRGAFDDGQIELTTPERSKLPSDSNRRESLALESANRIRTQASPFPLQDAQAPVKLDISYDGRPVPIEFRNGQAFLQEPKLGQRVQMTLTRSANVKETIGVVLKVNGENTLFRQTLRDLDCSKWLLTKEHPASLITGYQVRGKDRAEEFKVLSSAESEKKSFDYGRNVGQIQMTVFRESKQESLPTLINEEEEDLVALMRGVHPEEPPMSSDALKAQIRASSVLRGPESGGLIVPGKESESKIELKTFTPDPTPIMSITITYYRPKNR